MPLTWIGVTAGMFAVQYLIAARFSPMIRVLLRLQSVYWLLGFPLRALYLVVLHPQPPSPMYDARLAATDYGSGLVDVLRVSAMSEAVYLVALLALLRFRGNRNSTAFVMTAPAPSALVILLALGWTGRIGALVGLTSVGRALSPFGLVGSGLLVLTLKEPGRIRSRLLLITVFVGELTWSLIIATKTPIISLLTALLLRWAWSLRPASARARLPLIGAAVLGVFLLIQPLKGIHTVEESSTYLTPAQSRIGLGPATGILQRTDLLSAATDAYYEPDRPWLGYKRYASQFMLSVVPKGPLFDHVDSGALWAREVRSTTDPAHVIPVGLSLATGPAAEGYVEAGWLGVFVENALLAGITVLVGRAFASKRAFAFATAGMFAFGGTLYEAGILGQAEAISKSIEISLVLWLVTLLLPRPAPPMVVGKHAVEMAVAG
jgi:hypothetical protein